MAIDGSAAPLVRVAIADARLVGRQVINTRPAACEVVGVRVVVGELEVLAGAVVSGRVGRSQATSMSLPTRSPNDFRVRSVRCDCRRLGKPAPSAFWLFGRPDGLFDVLFFVVDQLDTAHRLRVLAGQHRGRHGPTSAFSPVHTGRRKDAGRGSASAARWPPGSASEADLRLPLCSGSSGHRIGRAVGSMQNERQLEALIAVSSVLMCVSSEHERSASTSELL